MDKSIPQVCNGFLADISGTHDIPQPIPLESAEWYAWLERHRVFGFASSGKNFTARKEPRSGGWYWYAYRRKQGVLSTAYLGKSKGLTRERLQTISSVLALKSPPSLKGPSLQALTPLSEPTQWKTPLITKLRIPPVSSHLIARPSLIEQLNAHMQNKLVLLSAPAGSGKTTVLCEWAAQCSWPVAWLSLEDSDNDPVRFWTYILAALEHTFQPGIGKGAQALLHMRPPVSIEAVVTELVNAIASRSQDVTLVLDNYHVIHNQLIHAAQGFLLDHLPATLHLMISSRVDPPLPLTRLRASCQLTELRFLDLQFTSDEVMAFCSRTTERALPAEKVSLLGAVTEGWVAGLQLILSSLRQMQDISSVPTTLAGHNRYVFDYLDNEVLQKQPRKVQLFLLKTSILERFNGPLCDALTGQRNSQHMLEQLEKANLFIVPLDHQRRWYRYHHLFRELLRTQLGTTQPDQLSQLHTYANQWYKQHGLIADAVEHALTAGDFLEAANLIRDVGHTMIRNNEVHVLGRWLETFPNELLVTRPRLCLFQGWLSITIGQVAQGETWVRQAQQGLDEKMRFSLSSPAPELITLQGEIAALHSHLAVFQGNIPLSTELAHQALKLLPKDDLFLHSLSELTLGIADWLCNDIQAAKQALAKADALGQIANNHYVALTSSYILIHIQIAQGQLPRAFQTAQQILQAAIEKEGQVFWVTAGAYIARGQILSLWNDLEAATRSLQEGIALSQRWQHRDLMAYGYTIMAQVKQAQGNLPVALRMIQLAERSLHGSQWLASVMATLQIRLALLQGNFDVGQCQHQTDVCNYAQTFEQLALAQIYLTQNQAEKALNILEQQLHIAETQGLMGRMVDIYLLQTKVYQKQQAIPKALQALEQALCLAEPGCYIRPFVESGPPLRALLASLLERSHAPAPSSRASASPAYLKQVLAAFEQPITVHRVDPERSSSLPAEAGQVEILSQREVEVLRLVLAGLPTRDMARQLVVAENTVRWHIRNIYSKLHVHNRAQLVVQTQRLGLHLDLNDLSPTLKE